MILNLINTIIDKFQTKIYNLFIYSITKKGGIFLARFLANLHYILTYITKKVINYSNAKKLF